MRKIVILIILLFFSKICLAGEFSVTPIRIDLDRDNQSASITVTNEGKTPINFVIKEMLWTQDKEGNDNYTSSQDLIYFPKSFKLEGGTSRIIRVGLKKVTPNLYEKAYRLFIEEVPEERLAGQTVVAIAIRFGVPVFIKPDKEELSFKIEKVLFEKDTLNLYIHNYGNRSFRFNTIDVTGLDESNREIFKSQIAGWYIFPNVIKKFTTNVSPENCKKINKLIFILNTETKVFREEINVQKEQCPI